MGCDDSRIGPLVMYQNMLKEERRHFEKINKIVYNDPHKFNGVLSGIDQNENGIDSANVL